MTVRKVTVSNETKNPMWVMIRTERCQAIGTKMRKVGDSTFEAFLKIVMKGEANVSLPAGLGIGASTEFTPELQTKFREFYEENKEMQYQWNGFIVEGALKIESGRSNDFSFDNAASVYYLTARNMILGTVADNVSRSEDSIIIDDKGIYDKYQYKVMINAQSDDVYLRCGDDKYIGIPPMYGTFDVVPAGKVDDAASKHKILVDSENTYITSGDHVRITCCDEKTNNDRMYSTQYGSVYYQPHATWNQQLWKIIKTTNPNNSEGDKCCYGDEVKIYNKHWPEAILTYDNDNWLRCHNDITVENDRKRWILCRSPKK